MSSASAKIEANAAKGAKLSQTYSHRSEARGNLLLRGAQKGRRRRVRLLRSNFGGCLEKARDLIRDGDAEREGYSELFEAARKRRRDL